jgi:uncharacterized membrane protein YcaP (DUF421 family)
MPGGAVDWSHLLIPTTPIVEIVLRGTVVYLAIFLMLRLVLKRQSGMVGEADILVVVLIADAAQNAMADGYRSIPEGLVLVGTILFWSYALDRLGFRFPRVQRLLRPPPLPLVRDGRLLRRNMRLELITRDELMSLLREHGVEDLARVKQACLEGDGRLSIVPCEGTPLDLDATGPRPG